VYAKQSFASGAYNNIYSTLNTSYAHTAMGIFNYIEPPSPVGAGTTPYAQSTAAWRNYLLPRGEAYAATVTGFSNQVMSSFSTTTGFVGVNIVDAAFVTSSGNDSNAGGAPTIAEQGSGIHQGAFMAFGGATRGAATTRLKVTAIASAGYFKLRQQMSYTFKVLVVARQVVPHPTNGPVVVGTPGDSAAWEFTGLCKRDEYTQATGTVTLAGVPAAGSTLTIGGVTLTAVSGAPGALQFDISSGNTTTIASNIRAAINTGGNGINFVSTQVATAALNVVTLKAYPVGTAGNAVTMSTSDPVNYVLSGATLAGGVDTAVTLVGISAAGATAPTYNDAGAATWTAEINVDATKQSLDVICTGQAGKYIKWEATIISAEAGRRPWNY
jgi:hypothetical protein